MSASTRELEVTLLGTLAQRHEVKHERVTSDPCDLLGVLEVERSVEVGDSGALALVQAGADCGVKLGLRPTTGALGIPRPCGRLGLRHERGQMSPGKVSQAIRETIGPRGRKRSHPVEIRHRVPACSRERQSEVRRQTLHHARVSTPEVGTLLVLAPEYFAADLPVDLGQLGVDRSRGARLRAPHAQLDVLEELFIAARRSIRLRRHTDGQIRHAGERTGRLGRPADG